MARGRTPRFDATAWLARYLVGPADVADPRLHGRETTEAERAREGELRDDFERVVDASGHVYLVPRDHPDTP